MRFRCITHYPTIDIMPRFTYNGWKAQCPEKKMSTLREDTRLSDGHESNFSEATESEFKVGLPGRCPHVNNTRSQKSKASVVSFLASGRSRASVQKTYWCIGETAWSSAEQPLMSCRTTRAVLGSSLRSGMPTLSSWHKASKNFSKLSVSFSARGST